MRDQHGDPIPATREDFARHMPKLFQAWSDGRLEGAPETYQNFTGRVSDVMAEFAAKPGRSLLVTSGGVIGTAIKQTLGLELQAYARICLSIMNTSMHQWDVLDGTPLLHHFNGVPHLDFHDRHHAKTYI